ncbi:MAG: 4-(cytidine 5'-diphospho)-2-C-methyl-D-erythritol kinase [Chlorobi bacterium]|nr:4-(cytidine 5'-diphospho)-2-C-methyl-D-erythritol kinase [Chlorobiota bacterium]
MIVFPNAKINIGLNITEKRKDGFHNLETIFYPVSLSDILEFTVSKDKTTFNNSGLKIDVPSDKNLVITAYQLLKKKYNLPELHIHLHKIIPFGAGLGGGSSDAAFMLKSLNNYFKLKLTTKTLENYAQKLGSDCPFFIKNNAVIACGTGNIFTEVKINLSNYFILIVIPNIQVSTKEAFKGINPEETTKWSKKLINLPVSEWKNIIRNDFEESIFKLYPEIKTIKDNLYRKGALYAQMSGSGSSIFGIFNKKPEITNTFNKYFTFLQKPLYGIL